MNKQQLKEILDKSENYQTDIINGNDVYYIVDTFDFDNTWELDTTVIILDDDHVRIETECVPEHHNSIIGLFIETNLVRLYNYSELVFKNGYLRFLQD